MNDEINQLARRIWDYMHLHHTLVPSDLILTLGSNDLRVAEHAADCYLKGLAPLLMFSGNVGVLTRGVFAKPEAELFAEAAIKKGVPRAAILCESESTNTGDNIRFSYRLLQERGIQPQSIILVQKPYMERRAYATFMKQWPAAEKPEVLVTSPPLAYESYADDLMPKEMFINVMVGDLQRIREYPKLGFQIEQEIPAEVWRAYERLVTLGFNQRLL
ncbi:MAG: YdcF family protein [Acidobacteria bacterium]|nr:YdcF family protein [Acidobacteriota bacterium]